MQEMMTVDAGRDLLKKSDIRILSKKCSDFLIDYDSDHGMIVDGLRLDKSLVRSIQNHLGVNQNTLAEYKGAPDIMRSMIDHSLFKRKDTTVYSKSCRLTGTIIGMSTEPMVDPMNLFDIVAGIQKWQGVYDITLNRGVLGFKFISERNTEPAKRKGDISHAGISMSYNGSVCISPYVYRMVCSNGLMAPYEVVKFEDVRSQCIAETLTRAIVYLEEFVHLSDVEVDQPAEVLNHSISNLSPGMRSDIMDELPNREGNTLYDLVNVITKVGSNKADSNFDIVGLDIMRRWSKYDPMNTCPTCNRVKV